MDFAVGTRTHHLQTNAIDGVLRYPPTVLQKELPNIRATTRDDQEAMPIAVNVLRAMADQVRDSEMLPAL